MVSPAAQASRTVAGPAAAAAVNPASTPVSGTPATTSLLPILAVHAIGRLPLLHPTLDGFTLDADTQDDDDNDDADEHRVLIVMLMVMLRVCVT